MRRAMLAAGWKGSKVVPTIRSQAGAAGVNTPLGTNVAGDLLVLFCYGGSSNNADTTTVTGPAGWTQQYNSGPRNGSLGIFTKVSTGGEATASWTLSPNYGGIGYSCAITAGTWGGASGGGASGNYDPPIIVAQTGPYLVISGCMSHMTLFQSGTTPYISAWPANMASLIAYSMASTPTTVVRSGGGLASAGVSDGSAFDPLTFAMGGSSQYGKICGSLIVNG